MRNNRPIRDMTTEEILFQLLSKECRYYQRILELTEEEHRLLESTQPLHSVTQLMKQKKVLLACIQEVESALQPIKKRWQANQDEINPFTQKVRQKLAELDELLKATLKLDSSNQKLFQKKLLRLREQAKSQGRKALKAK